MPNASCICTSGGRLRQSHHFFGFQSRKQPLLPTFASKILSQSGGRKVAQVLQDPARPSARPSVKPSSLRVVPAHVETKSQLPAQPTKASVAASGGAPYTAASVPSDPPPGFRRCIDCQRAKLLVDFTPTAKSSRDGLSEVCRACLAVYRAKRGGRELGHLGLSIGEAWQQAKTCSRCQVSKEARDFPGKKVAPDGLNYYCRSCKDEVQRRQPDWPSVDHPLKCKKCWEVKPANEFAMYSRSRTGRQSTCRICANKRRKELDLERQRAGLYIKRKRKLCTMCKESTEVPEFHRKRLTMDGLYYACKKCVKEINEQKGKSL